MTDMPSEKTLDYAARLAAMRETKLRHTLEKRTQNGYTDLDDFGTVPISGGYRVEVWSNSENGSFYGFDGMSENFCRVISAHEPYVDPNEMLCGRWRDMLVNYRGDLHYAPEWLKQNPALQKLNADSTNQWSKRWDESRFPYDSLKPLQKKYNITSGIDGDAHFACDYRIGFELGFPGLLEKIRKYRKRNPEAKAFYDAEEKCLLAVMDFVKRHIGRIREMIPRETRPELKANLEKMLEVNEKLLVRRPETFHEVCQWTAYFNCASRIYTRDGAGFRLDELLYPYYLRDTEAGILDDETAKFLLANLLLIDPHYYQISGIDSRGNDITNKLSYLVLEAADSINIACNLTVRVHENCDPGLLNAAVHYLFKNKNAWPRFCNDRTLSEGYVRTGADIATARDRIAVGCNWMCVPGREFPMNDTVKINTAKVLEVALGELRAEKERSVEKLFALFEKHLEKAIDVTAEGINLHLDHQWEVTPELIMNLMMHGSLERGLDASQCAEFFTIGVDGAGLATTADSLGALAERVERERLVTFDEVFDALDNDFEGAQSARVGQILASAGKYCSGGSAADRFAERLTETWVRLVRARSAKMPQGRQLLPGWFSWSRTIEYGSVVGATPNGRKAGAPISHGANPSAHFRQDGAVSAQSTGIAAVQCGFGNTAPLQLEFDPGITESEGGAERVTELIKTHFKLGGTLININVLDADKLMKAHKDPDLYPDLVVRVTGFTAYFASLSPEFRQLVIDRFLKGI